MNSERIAVLFTRATRANTDAAREKIFLELLDSVPEHRLSEVDAEAVREGLRFAYWRTLKLNARWLPRLTPFVSWLLDDAHPPGLCARDHEILMAFMDDGVPGLSLIASWRRGQYLSHLH